MQSVIFLRQTQLILGDAKRSMIGEGKSLIDMDAEMLRGKLPEGFLIRRRKVQGVGCSKKAQDNAADKA